MNLLEKFRDIHTFIFDVDGVMTNNDLIVLESGDLLRKMSIRDGFAIKKAIKGGYRVCVITGGTSFGVMMRLKNLGVNSIYHGIQDKLEIYEEYIHALDIDPAEILYMGDDIPDYEVMRRVGLPCCPVDAVPEIAEISQYISPKKGGEGCVRDVIEKVLKLQGNWLDESPETLSDNHSY